MVDWQCNEILTQTHWGLLIFPMLAIIVPVTDLINRDTFGGIAITVKLINLGTFLWFCKSTNRLQKMFYKLIFQYDTQTTDTLPWVAFLVNLDIPHVNGEGQLFYFVHKPVFLESEMILIFLWRSYHQISVILSLHHKTWSRLPNKLQKIPKLVDYTFLKKHTIYPSQSMWKGQQSHPGIKKAPEPSLFTCIYTCTELDEASVWVAAYVL